MIFLDNIPIMATISQIMFTLQRELKGINSHYLNRIIIPKYEYADIQFCCPFHKGGFEQKPSAGITVIEKQRDGRIIPAGTFSCFACKQSGDITTLISYCFGKQDGGMFGRDWILSRFNNFDIENREGFFHIPEREEKKKEDKIYIDDEELDKYRYYHPYMYKRHLTDKLIDYFDIGYQKNFELKQGMPMECITFPIKDESGRVIFIARRGIKNKIFHYKSNTKKILCYLYEAQQLFPDSKELYICESLFNALTFYKWGKPAVALLGTGSREQLEMLKALSYRKYILCLDGDAAGQRGTKKLNNALKQTQFIEIIKMPTEKDVNDFAYLETYEEFLEQLKKEGM